MSRSFTYNLIVTRSAESINKIFFDEDVPTGSIASSRTRRITAKSIENLGKSLDGRDLSKDVLVSPFNNNELIKFETTFPGAGNTKFVTLRLIETQRILEKFIIPTDGVSDSISRKFRKRVKNLKEVTGDLLNAMKSIRPRYYFSFGVGDDVSKWAGPFCVDLIDANLTITQNGLREIELAFTPTIESIKVFTNKVYLDRDIVQNSNVFYAISANETKLEIKSYLDFDVANPFFRGRPNAQQRSRLNVNVPPTRLAGKAARDGWNYAIRRLIQKFLSDRFRSVEPGNVLVLFPHDLNAEAGDENALINVKPPEGKIIDIVALHRSRLIEYGITISTLTPKNVNAVLTGRKTTIASNVASDTIRASILEAQRALKNPRLQPDERNKLNESIKVNQKALKRIKDETRVIEKAQESFDKVDKEIDPGTLIRQLEEGKPQNPDYTYELDKRKNINKIQLGFVGEINTNNIDDNTLETLKPLIKFFRTLKSNSSESMNLTIFQENDLKVTRLLKEHDLIDDGEAPVTVIGDEYLINNLLYPIKDALPVNLNSALTIYDDPYSTSFKWKDYITDFYNQLSGRIVRGKKGLTSSFEEEIDFGHGYRGFENSIKPDMLVFMHNMKNSNVLDISVDSSPYKGELLDLANESQYRIIDDAIKGDQTVFDNTFKFNEADYVISKLKSDGFSGTPNPQEILDVLKTDQAFIRSLKDSKGQESLKVVDFLDFVYFKLKYVDVSSFDEDIVSKCNPGLKGRSDADIVEKINKFVFQVKLRTLPFFNTNYYQNRRCYLMGTPNKIIGSNIFKPDLQRKVPPPSIFTNSYLIYGYKHVITPNEAYSEFELYQDGITPNTNLNLTLYEYFQEEISKLRDEGQEAQPSISNVKAAEAFMRRE